MHHDKHGTDERKGWLSWLLSWKGVGLIMGLAGVSYYLLTMHLAHLAVALPYLLLLACPLMHIFGHKHGHDDKKQD